MHVYETIYQKPLDIFKNYHCIYEKNSYLARREGALGYNDPLLKIPYQTLEYLVIIDVSFVIMKENTPLRVAYGII